MNTKHQIAAEWPSADHPFRTTALSLISGDVEAWAVCDIERLIVLTSSRIYECSRTGDNVASYPASNVIVLREQADSINSIWSFAHIGGDQPFLAFPAATIPTNP